MSLSSAKLDHLFEELDLSVKNFKNLKNSYSNEKSFTKAKFLRVTSDLFVNFIKQKKINLLYKFFLEYLNVCLRKISNKDVVIFSLNYLNSLINFSEDSSEISFILNLFSLTIPCLTQVHSYMKTKKIIIEQLYGNYYNIDCLDKTKLKIDQWVSVANKFFSRYDSKKIIDEISHKISSSPYLSNKQDCLDPIIFIEICADKLLQIKNCVTTKSEEEAQNLLSSSRENKNKISINRSISVKTLDRKCLKKEIDMIDQLKRELSLEKKEKAKVNLLANKINEFLKIFLKILKENKILETFLEDLMTGYNNLLNYTYEIEKVIGVKNGGGIFFLQNIERLSIIIEEIKDCKSFSNFSKNIQYLTKSETRNELSMISSLNGSINKFPEECPEECNSFPKIRKFSKINYKKSFDISNI